MRVILLILCMLALACSKDGAGEAPKSKVTEFKTITVGEEVRLEDHAIAGKITIFDFYADWCPPCKKLDISLANLKELYGDRLEVLKLDLVDWQSPLARQFEIGDLPYLIIYGTDGKLLESGSEGTPLQGPSNKVLPLLIAEMNR